MNEIKGAPALNAVEKQKAEVLSLDLNSNTHSKPRKQRGDYERG